LSAFPPRLFCQAMPAAQALHVWLRRAGSAIRTIQLAHCFQFQSAADSRPALSWDFKGLEAILRGAGAALLAFPYS